MLKEGLYILQITEGLEKTLELKRYHIILSHNTILPVI